MKRFVTAIFSLVLVVALLAGCLAPGPGKQKPQQQQSPAGAKTYHDGTYTAVSDADDHGYAVASVTIKNDKMTEVKLTEIMEKGVEKDYAAYPYPASKEARDALQKAFVEKNSVEVDNYTKATHSSEKYKQAVGRALEKAKINPSVTSTYFDGTFQGKSKADEHGYGIALVTVKGDKITNVVLKEITEKNEFKDYSTYPYKPAIEAQKELPAKYVESGGRPVDAFTGATQSTAKWNEAVADALALAKVK